MEAYRRVRLRVPSTLGNRYRLEADHILPGGPSILQNMRLLCPGCNMRRGPAHRSDVEVLTIQRRRWEKALPPRQLWWLNIQPGWGGLPFRGKKH